MSIDVFPRLHERDPYRWLLLPLVPHLQGPLLSSFQINALIFVMLDWDCFVLQAAGCGEGQLF